MKNFAEKIFAAKFETNEKGQLKQNVRNQLKADIMEELAKTLENAGVSVFRTIDGIAVELPHDELGSIAVVFDGTVKGLEYDVIEAENELKAKIAEKAEKEKKAAELKAQKIAEKALLKAKQAEKKMKATQ